MTSLRKTAINMISGGAGYFFPIIINLIATPLLISHLGQEAYGLQSLVSVVIGYLLVTDLGLDIPIVKFIAEYQAKNDLLRRDKLISNTFQMYLLIGIIGMVVIVFFSQFFLNDVFNISPNLQYEAKIVFIIAGLGFLGNIFSMWGKAVFIGLQRYDIANGVQVICNLASSIIGIVLVIKGYGIIYFVLVKIIFFFIASLTYFIKMVTFLDFKIRFGLDKEILSLLKPQIGYGLILRVSGMFFSKLDQSLLGAWVGLAAVAAYSIPMLITTALSGLISSLINFTFPMASELFFTNNKEKFEFVFFSSNKLIAVLASLLFIPLICLGDIFLELWIGRAFSEQVGGVLVVLSIAIYFNLLLTCIMNNFIVAIGKINVFTVFSISKSVIMAFGCVILVKAYGIMGAALAVLASLIVDFIYFHKVTSKYLNIDISKILKESFMKPIILSLFLGTLLGLTRYFVNTWIEIILVIFFYVVFYILCGYFISIFAGRERKLITDFLKNVTLLFIKK